MSFSDEIKENFFKSDISDVICTLSLSSGITIEGYKKILELSDSKLLLLCNNAIKLQILGSDFCIKEIAYGEICVSGEIDSVTKL